MYKAVFLDRDGVINENPNGYIRHHKEFVFLPRVVDAFRKLYESEFKVIVITNQGGIGKGAYTKEDVDGIHNKMHALLNKDSIRIDGIYYCHHHPHDDCGCRKPRLGMLRKAMLDHEIDFKKSFFVGDKTSDIKAGKKAGCKTILVKTGYGGKDNRHNVKPDFVVSDLLDAVKTILKVTTVK